MARSTGSSGGIGLSGLLTVLFVGLKLCGVIAWPWVWVVAPIWIPMVIVFVGVCIILGVQGR